ncbi:MAG TPA: SulP family inorganic anion transporter, partial [Phycisphaerales bacterium]|nr:SulP family inorganic anion transporter [Phycisphaerales bacterium]
MAAVSDWVPIVGALRGYHPAWLGRDLIAGASVSIVMIPSVIAYAELAGLAPQHGLYAALAGMVAYALFASSRHVIVGPDAAITLLVATAVAPLVAQDPSRIVTFSAMTALLGAGVMLLAAIFKLGSIADFLSKPVLVGYLSGAALILISTQLDKLFGIKLESQDFFPRLWELARRLPETHGVTLGLGVGFIVLLEVLRRLTPAIPGPLVVFVGAIVL